MTNALEMTTQDKLDAVERELGLRRRVYPRMIEGGKCRRTSPPSK